MATEDAIRKKVSEYFIKNYKINLEFSLQGNSKEIPKKIVLEYIYGLLETHCMFNCEVILKKMSEKIHKELFPMEWKLKKCKGS